MSYGICPHCPKAYEGEDRERLAHQVRGHILGNHQGEAMPQLAEIEIVDELPEGYTVVKGKKERKAEEETEEGEDEGEGEPIPKVAKKAKARAKGALPDPQSEKATVLDDGLATIGVSGPVRQNILAAFRRFRMFQENPQNLYQLISNWVKDQSVRNMIHLVITEVFPEQPPTEPAFYYQPWPSAPPYSPFAASWSRPWGQPGNPWENTRRSAEPDPRIEKMEEELQQSREITQRLLAERDEEKRERKEAEEKQVLEGRFKTVEEVQGKILDRLQDVVKLVMEKEKQGAVEQAQGQTSALVEEVKNLRQTIKENAEKQVNDTLGNIATSIVTLAKEVDLLKTKPTVGKSTEDLVSDAVTLLAPRIDSLGSSIKDELTGVREAITQGKLPVIQPPAGQGNVVDQAQRIAKVAHIENEVLEMTGGSR